MADVLGTRRGRPGATSGGGEAPAAGTRSPRHGGGLPGRADRHRTDPPRDHGRRGVVHHLPGRSAPAARGLLPAGDGDGRPLESATPAPSRRSPTSRSPRRAGFGAYIGVPVKQPDGSPFGTLCCLSHTPRPELGDAEVTVLQALADQLGFHVAQLAEHREEISGPEDFAAELAASLQVEELRLEVFQHLVDASSNPKLLLDPESLGVVYANAAAAAVAGIERDRLVGRLAWQLHPCWEIQLRRWLEPLRTGEADEVQYEIEPTDRSPAMDAQAQRVSSDGGPAFILWTGHDVTHHREAEERLEHALELERNAAAELRRLDVLRRAF